MFPKLLDSTIPSSGAVAYGVKTRRGACIGTPAIHHIPISVIMTDRGYVHLLSHLHRSTTTVSFSAIQTWIVHYLAHLQPSPTPLAAAVVSSPLFRPITHEKVGLLKTAFRHAVHVKVKLLREEPRSVFVRGVSARTTDWVRAVLKGFHGGHSMMRLACSGGLLQGLSDLEAELHNKDSRVRREVEEEAIVALAEAIDMYSPVSPSVDWQRDFQHESYEGKGESVGRYHTCFTEH